MHESGTMLSAWESFYVIVGSSGGALIGLQFVVITLIADREHLGTPGSVGAFGTPTVVHFAMALVISAIMSAPWPTIAPVSVMMAMCGFGGLVYVAIVIRRARRQTTYKPVLEDWIWHVTLPFITYGALFVSDIFLRSRPDRALFGIGGCALILLLIGIHNAWDTVTYIAISRPESTSAE